MITKKFFAKHGEADVYEYILENSSGVSASILNYGGIIKNLWVKDAHGASADVVGGFDSLEGYKTSGGYQGALIGRVGNRIGGARFTLDGKTYELYKNDGNNSLHGGECGFDKKLWEVSPSDNGNEPSLVLTYTSPDGEEGYPGTLAVTVTYTLLEIGALSIRYEAVTDKTTVLNLTNHAYFNLSGIGSDTVDDMTLWLDADKINSIDSELIPAGELADVTGTPYDLRTAKRFGDAFADANPMMQSLGGYDNNFCFTGHADEIKHRATLTDPKSGRVMKCYTDQPCVQIYTANMVNPDDPAFKCGVKQYKHCAVCLETQAMPDAVNHDGFTNTVLKPGEKYDKTTIYAFENM